MSSNNGIAFTVPEQCSEMKLAMWTDKRSIHPTFASSGTKIATWYVGWRPAPVHTFFYFKA